MSDIRPIQEHNFRPVRAGVDPKIHETKEAQRLKETCQQFEAILWSKIWKEMRATAKSFSSDGARTWRQMEDLSIEMATEDLVARSEGAGLWKMLYDSMIDHLAAERDAELAATGEARTSFEARG